MLDLAPEIEKTVRDYARKEGLTESDYIARLVQKVAQKEPSAAPVNATEALFAQWDAEDADMTDAERRDEDTFWDEFAQGIDESRHAAGMRLLF